MELTIITTERKVMKQQLPQVSSIAEFASIWTQEIVALKWSNQQQVQDL